MNFKKILLILVALVILVIAGLAIALATFDANKYRGQIADVLTKQTGRSVKLTGPISLGLSLHGATLTIQDAAIGNPSWASRSQMAGIGHFELGVAVMPLLTRQISISEVQIADADILLETGPNDQHNWDMAPTTQPGEVKTQSAAKPSSSQSVAIQVDNVSIKDSQLAIRGKDGKINIFKTSAMTFGREHGGVAIHFIGEYDGTPIKLDLKSAANDFSSKSMDALDVDLTYANYLIRAKGKASLSGKQADITSYEVASGSSNIHGQFSADWNKTPSVQGTLQSDKLNSADFKPAAGPQSAASDKAQPEENPQFIFSDAALPFDALKSVNAVMKVDISELTLGNGMLTNLSSKLVLQDGHLSMPVKFTLGNSPMSGNINLNAAASPAQLAVTFSAPDAELADILHFAGAPAFLTGKANADINVTSAGDSMHALASHANGKIDVIGGNGSISKSAAGDLSSTFMDVLGGSSALNCMAARFNITNGVMKDNGILLDSSSTTIAGEGQINLGAEVVNMTMRARNKVVSVTNVLPPLHITGTFAHPSFGVDPNAMVQNVAGALLSGSLPNLTDSGVPNMLSAPGQNACVYTLDHPAAAAPTQQKSVLVPGLAGQAGQKVKDIGNQLMKGLLGN